MTCVPRIILKEETVSHPDNGTGQKGVLRKSDDGRGMKQRRRKSDGLNLFWEGERRCTNIGGSSGHSLVEGPSTDEGSFVTDTTPVS